jgi:hypothetical protein
MKFLISNALVAICMIATLSSCAKDEQAVVKSVKTSSLPPPDFTYIDRGQGELYFPDDKLTTYTEVNDHYLLLRPLSLQKYNNGALLDSVCNKDIALVFQRKGRKTYDKSAKCGSKPSVAEEYAPIVTFEVDNTLTIKSQKWLQPLTLN